MIKRIIFILMTLGLFSMIAAQDVYNWPVRTDTSKTYDNFDVGYGYIRYGGVVRWTDVGDSSYNIHTKPILIGNGNTNDGFITTNVVLNYGAASDFIVRYHFSNDLETWVTVSDTDVDQDADQVDADTLGIVQGVNDLYFHSYKWMIVEFDGQTANIESQVVKWGVTLKLSDPHPMVNGNPVYSLGGIAQPGSIKANP